MAICCQYVLASGVSLALSPFGCHKLPVSSLLTCILVTHVHLSLMQTVTCLTIVSHFTLHLFASFCLLSYLLINTLLAAYFSLFAPHCYCPPMFTVLYHCIFYTCVLFVLCTLLAACMLVQPCTLIVPCTLIAYLPLYVPLLSIPHWSLHPHQLLLTASWWLHVHSLLCSHFLLLMVHPALCIFTICNTILMSVILVAHLTPLAHRCSLYYIQSQFSLTHHYIPNYLLFPDTHTLCFTCPFSLTFTCHLVHISCFVYTFSLVNTHCPTYANLLIHAHYFFILIGTSVQFHLCLFLFHPHTSLNLHLLVTHTFGLMLTQCSLRTCLPLVVVIFLNASLTHFLLHAQLLFYAPSLPLSTSSLHSCIRFTHTWYLPPSSCSVHTLLTAHSLSFPCSPSYDHIISSHILCILEHQLLICPPSHMSFPLALPTLLFSWVFFSSDSHSFHHFNVQLCHPPTLHFTTTFLYFIHCYYLLPLLLIFQLHF